MRQPSGVTIPRGFHVGEANINPNGTWVKLPFTNVKYGIGWDKVNYEYVIPINGLWTFAGTVGFNAPATARFSLSIYVNGASRKTLCTIYPLGSGGGDIHINGGVELMLQQNDRVSLWTFCSVSSGTRNSLGESWFTGVYTGAEYNI